jgi:hypothetical protein
MQQSIESFVFVVLDAQAKTRWSIVDQGTKSLQTQDAFYKVMQDTIVRDDVTVSISNIKNTNVVLNFTIFPRLILIPSDLRIFTEPVA